MVSVMFLRQFIGLYCIFVCTSVSSGQITVNVLCSKSRVAPRKKQTIPRLKLCGALDSGDLMAD